MSNPVSESPRPFMSGIRSYLPETFNENLMFYVGRARSLVQGYVNDTFSASKITNNIFVGDLASASNKSAMLEQGITHVLFVMNGGYEIFPKDMEYKLIHVNDDPWVDISKYFAESNQFIDEAIGTEKLREGNKIMIHCQRGVSRSVTLLVAYELWKRNQKKPIPQPDIDSQIDSIMHGIKVHREIAEPNPGFMKCLQKYVHDLNSYEWIDNDIQKPDEMTDPANDLNPGSDETKSDQ